MQTPIVLNIIDIFTKTRRKPFLVYFVIFRSCFIGGVQSYKVENKRRTVHFQTWGLTFNIYYLCFIQQF